MHIQMTTYHCRCVWSTEWQLQKTLCVNIGLSRERLNVPQAFLDIWPQRCWFMFPPPSWLSWEGDAAGTQPSIPASLQHVLNTEGLQKDRTHLIAGTRGSRIPYKGRLIQLISTASFWKGRQEKRGQALENHKQPKVLMMPRLFFSSFQLLGTPIAHCNHLRLDSFHNTIGQVLPTFPSSSAISEVQMLNLEKQNTSFAKSKHLGWPPKKQINKKHYLSVCTEHCF